MREFLSRCKAVETSEQSMQLNPLHVKVATLLQGRLFRIPEYQRAYSWGTRQRTDLFNDIVEVYRSGREHFMATIVALARDTRTIGADEYRTVELVDGQQRITTIIVLLKAIEKALSVEDAAQGKVKRETQELLVKNDEHSLILLQTNHDSSNVFTNYIRTGDIDSKSVTTSAETNLVLESDSNRLCNARSLILLGKPLARIDHTAAGRVTSAWRWQCRTRLQHSLLALRPPWPGAGRSPQRAGWPGHRLSH
jgi:uncharacterized protein with ParB-like and HNH nuclease domain